MPEEPRDYAIISLDGDGRIRAWDAAAEAMHLYSSADVVGERWAIFHENPAAAENTLALARANGRTDDLAWRRRKDGSRFWCDTVVLVAGDGFVCVERDDTMAEALIRQQAAFCTLARASLTTREIQLLVERAVELVGDALDVAHVALLQQTDDGLVARAGTNGLVAGSVTHSSQARFTLLHDEPVVVADFSRDGRFVPDYDAKSGITVPIASCTDADAWGVLAVWSARPRRYSDEDLHFVESVASLLALSIDRRRREDEISGRDEFISVAAHELRTPLTALQLKLHALERAVVNTKAAERLEGALRQSRRLAELIDRLLDVSRIAGGRLEIAPEELDLAAIAREVALDLSTRIRVDAKEPIIGWWDRARIEQVLMNLLTNALKYGNGKPIEVAVKRVDDGVTIVVRDHGIGISDTAVGRIFERFERAAPLANYAGLGLGLYITRAIVEAHGGRIRVESKEGEGSSFIVELPRVARTPERADVRMPV